MLQAIRRSVGRTAAVSGAAVAATIMTFAILALPAGAQTAIGGSGAGTSDSGGGDGGTTSFVANPVATSGSSGTVSAGSTATNSGDTGDATSIAISNPFSASGASGGAGNSGATESTPSATNTVGNAATIGSASPVPAGGNQASSKAASSNTGVATDSAGGVPAEATSGLSAADPTLATAAELATPPAYEEPPAVDMAVTSTGVDDSVVAFSRTLVSEYGEAGTTNLLVLVLGFALAAKMARTFLRLNHYWDLAP